MDIIKLDAQEKSKIISINFYGDRDKMKIFFKNFVKSFPAFIDI